MRSSLLRPGRLTGRGIWLGRAAACEGGKGMVEVVSWVMATEDRLLKVTYPAVVVVGTGEGEGVPAEV